MCWCLPLPIPFGGLQSKVWSTSQKVPKSKGLQVKRSLSKKGYKSKDTQSRGPQSKGLQKFESQKGIKESCRGKTLQFHNKMSYLIIIM